MHLLVAAEPQIYGESLALCLPRARRIKVQDGPVGGRGRSWSCRAFWLRGSRRRLIGCDCRLSGLLVRCLRLLIALWGSRRLLLRSSRLWLRSCLPGRRAAQLNAASAAYIQRSRIQVRNVLRAHDVGSQHENDLVLALFLVVAREEIFQDRGLSQTRDPRQVLHIGIF